MNDMTATEEKLQSACAELKTAGPIHRRDLIRQIKRLQRKRRILARQKEAATEMESV